MSFSSFGLCEPVMRGVVASGYSMPTEIQRKAIPLILQGRDIIGCAPTGTGKTAAFVLPILHRLGLTAAAGGGRPRAPRALILTPTRELAQQIEEAARDYGASTGQRVVSVYGGVDIGRQLRGLTAGTDIIVATPGRLQDHIERRTVDLSRIEVLVLDEADRMLDMGFVHAVRAIIARLPVDRQTLLFSATISDEVRSLVHAFQRDPQTVDVGRVGESAKGVVHEFFAVPRDAKIDLLVQVLKEQPVETALVFSRTKHGADRIAKRLCRGGISAQAIHSNRSQSQRQGALDGFKRRAFKVLVATDVAARGIDVDNISHVINFDTPVFAEDYVHRVGRTGRAEASGTAYTFVSADEYGYVKRIQNLTGRRFDVRRYPGFAASEPPPVAAVEATAPMRPSRFQRRYYRPVRFA